jgi:TPR repeat protein
MLIIIQINWVNLLDRQQLIKYSDYLKINNINFGSCIVMDSHRKFINLNTPIINLIKFLTVATSFILTAPVFADTSQKLDCHIAINHDTAFHNCTKAAEQGEAKAQYYLGMMLTSGFATPQDDKQAAYWYTKAAEQGYAEAQYNLAVVFTDGQGVPQDDKQAVFWFTKAAVQGYAKAQFNLGNMYDRGEGTPKDYKQAVYWFTKAAEQGNASAQLNLGFMHHSGNGTLKDSIVAYAWYNVSASQGDEQATKSRGIIEEEMTPNQIAEAQKLSKEYYAKYVK